MEVESIKKYSKQLYNKLKSKKYGKRIFYDTDHKKYLTFGSNKIMVNIYQTDKFSSYPMAADLFSLYDDNITIKFSKFKKDLSVIKKDNAFKDYTMMEFVNGEFIPVKTPNFNYKVISYKYLDALRLFINKFGVKEFNVLVNEPTTPLQINFQVDNCSVLILVSEVLLKR